MKIKRFGNFIKAVGRHYTDGFSKVSEKVADERLDICKSCTEFFDEVNIVCKHKDCGCFLSIKTLWASESCPINKWGAVETRGTGTFNIKKDGLEENIADDHFKCCS